MNQKAIPDNFQPNRILIIQTAFLGDVVLTLPLVQSAVQLFPSAQIDFLTIPAGENILKTHPDIASLVIYDKRGEDRGISGLFRIIRKLRQARYDLALVPHRSFRSAFLAWSAAIPRRVGFDAGAGRLLYTHLIRYERKEGLHEIERNLKLLSVFTREIHRLHPCIGIDENDQAAVDSYLQAQNIPAGSRLIAIAPGSVWATKRWLPERYAEVATKLTEDGLHVVLIGGGADRPLCDRILEGCAGNVHNAAGKLSPRQSASLIQRCRLLITNDSAPLHLANAVNTPVIALFGPTVPRFGFFPYREQDRLLEDRNLRCRPCSIHGSKKCPIGTFDCMKNIETQQVLEAVRGILEKKISHKS